MYVLFINKIKNDLIESNKIDKKKRKANKLHLLTLMKYIH